MAITKKTVSEALKLTEDVLSDYIEDMDKAYEEGEDGVSVSVKLKFKPEEDGMKVISGISFVGKKVKDAGEITIREEK